MVRKFANFFTVSGNPNDPNAPVTLQLDSRTNIHEEPKFATVLTFRNKNNIRRLIKSLEAMLEEPIEFARSTKETEPQVEESTNADNTQEN